MPYTLKQNQEVMQLVVAGGRLEHPVGVPDEIYDEMLRCWNTGSINDILILYFNYRPGRTTQFLSNCRLFYKSGNGNYSNFLT